MSPVVGGDCCARPAADTNANDIAAAKEINRIEILLPKAFDLTLFTLSIYWPPRSKLMISDFRRPEILGPDPGKGAVFIGLLGPAQPRRPDLPQELPTNDAQRSFALTRR